MKPGEHDVSETSAVRRHLGVGLDVGHGPSPLVVVRLPLVHQLAEPRLLLVNGSETRKVQKDDNPRRSASSTAATAKPGTRISQKALFQKLIISNSNIPEAKISRKSLLRRVQFRETTLATQQV